MDILVMKSARGGGRYDIRYMRSATLHGVTRHADSPAEAAAHALDLRRCYPGSRIVAGPEVMAHVGRNRNA